MPSERARTKFYDVLQEAQAGNQVVIERRNKPVAALVNYGEWQRIKNFRTQELDRRLAEMDAGNYVMAEGEMDILDCAIEYENHEPVF